MNDDAKNIISFRVRPETLARIQAVVQEQGNRPDRKGGATVKPTVSLFISDLLEAYVERRMLILTEPFPYNINEGQDIEGPVLTSGGQDASGNHWEEESDTEDGDA